MTEHYLLTRAAYHPRRWTRDANLRRLRLFRAVTVPSLAAQTFRDWTWVLAVSPEDECLEERLPAAAEAGVGIRVVSVESAEVRSAAAVAAYQAAWADAFEPDDAGGRLTTRLDDDDAFARDAFERFQSAAVGLVEATSLQLPQGFRVWGGRYTRVRHESNAMASLWTPPGDERTVYSYLHRQIAQRVPVVFVDSRPGWLWVRHPDTLSGWKRATRPVTGDLRRLFDFVDWSVVGTRPRVEPVAGGERFS